MGILIHGCHLQAKEWENIVFGNQNKAGRVPIGVEEAVKRNAALIFWGSGASRTPDGKKESEYTYELTLGPKLSELAQRVNKSSEELLNYLKEVSVIDTKTQNTREEILATIEQCRSKAIEALYLVSSPTHIARCLQEACKIQEETPNTIKIYAIACETCFANSTAQDVTIVEPPHRGDRPEIYFNRTLKGIFPILVKKPQLADKLNQDMAALIESYQTQL